MGMSSGLSVLMIANSLREKTVHAHQQHIEGNRTRDSPVS